MFTLTADQLNERLHAESEPPTLIDVREPWEHAVAHLPQAQLIPMQQIPQRLDEFDRERDIVVMCHHGGRSRQVCEFLERQGFNRVFNLEGGINAWAKKIDPTMGQY